jgi:hypothetical protein
MDLSKILAISGKTGLFKIVSQLKNAVLVESLVDQKRFPAFAHDKISSMEEIAVFTTEEDKPLKEVLKMIYEKQDGKPAIDAKAGEKELKEFFAGMVPDYDRERVYISDIRKIISWYNLLLEHNLLDFTEKPEEEAKATETTEEKKEDTPQEDAEPKPAKKAGSGKSASKSAPATPRKKKGEE